MKPFLRPKDVQSLLDISARTYYRIVESGELPYTTLATGGTRGHLWIHLEIFLEKRRRKGRMSADDQMIYEYLLRKRVSVHVCTHEECRRKSAA